LNRYEDELAKTDIDIDNESLNGQNSTKRKQKTSKFKWFMLLLIAILFPICVTSGYEKVDDITTLDYVDKTFNVLIVGSDFNYDENGVNNKKTRSDILMLGIFPDGSDKVGLISIPRDTLVNISLPEKERINGAFYQGGIDLTKQVVSDLIGVDVNRYVIVDFDGFKEMVDILGGIEIDVEKRLKYDDNAGGIHIDLKPGLQVLDGQKSLDYVRFRNDALGDISRVSRQQNFMKSVAKKLLSWDGVKNYMSLWKTFTEYVITDISFNDTMALVRRLSTFEMTDMDTYTLPGHFKGAFWEADENQIEEIVNSIMSND